MVVKNQRRWDGSLGSAEAALKRCDFKCRRKVEKVRQERTLIERLFQTVGAAVRKPRVPNDKLQHAKDSRLAEVDRKDLYMECGWWRRLARYGGLPVLRALKLSIRALIGSQSSSFGIVELQSVYRMSVTKRAIVFWVRWRRENV